MRRELARVLSKAGLCSRTVAAEWIRAGRVRVDGVLVQDPTARMDPDRNAIVVDGRPIGDTELSYWALHKPRGYVTTRSDPDGRKTVYDLLGEVGEWVVPVGRLDLETSGLLLLTNDTQFAEYLTNPESHVEKTYRVTAKPRLAEAALERLRAGVVLKDGPTRPAAVKKIGDRGPCTVIEITITEGRNRQVRRMIVEVGAKVEKLARVSIGSVELGDLTAGKSRRLTAAEVRSLVRARSTKR